MWFEKIKTVFFFIERNLELFLHFNPVFDVRDRKTAMMQQRH